MGGEGTSANLQLYMRHLWDIVIEYGVWNMNITAGSMSRTKDTPMPE